MLHARKQRLDYRLKHGYLLWKRTVIQYIHRMERLKETRPVLLDLAERDRWYELYSFAEPNASLCNDARSYFEWAQLIALVKKYRGIPSKTQSLNPELKARGIWLASEASCGAMNDKIRNRVSGDEFSILLARVRFAVRAVIGEQPDLDAVYDGCDFSSGASIGVHGDNTSLAAKFFASRWTVTPSAYIHFVAAVKRTRYVAEGLTSSEICGSPLKDHNDFGEKLQWVSGNKLAFVPKTMAVHRSIAVEPMLNSFLQRGADLHLRELLRVRLGIDLRHQEPNQRMARQGSIDGRYATIDLSSASDSISRLLVKELLPYHWHRLLNELRSPTTADPKFGTVQLEKFCSMGNGFCFPLQTLIFAAVCMACGSKRGEFRVYGDDIICRSELAPVVIDALMALGFTPNRSKTFFEGPFRESCGADWWEGRPVRPAYAVKSWDDIRAVASFHNTALRLWPDDMKPLLQWLRSKIPDDQLLLRPCDDADGDAFNAPLDQCMSRKTVWWDRDYQNWRWVAFSSIPIPDRSGRGSPGYDFLAYLAVLRGASADIPFASRRKTRTTTRACSWWPLPT